MSADAYRFPIWISRSNALVQGEEFVGECVSNVSE